MKLRIGFSPCPNDTFIFDALVHGKIDTGDIQFEPILEDVETLNQWAIEGKLDITKLSFPALFSARNHYQLLVSGSALGKGVGPLLVTKENSLVTVPDINHRKVLLPGSNTTAHLLFSLAFPNATQKEFIVFSAIEEALLQNSQLLGVLIHENRFTYEKKGLSKIMDLGNFWEEHYKVPTPLGEMEEDIMRKHIMLYVNEYSRSLGAEGRQAIQVLFEKYLQLQDQVPTENQFPLFV